MKDVHIKYLVLKYEDALAAQKRSAGEIRQLEGKAKIGTIGKYSEGVTKTEQFPMQETRLAPGYSWTSGGKETSEDKMEGIWVKVYAGDLLVTEATKPENLARTMSWD